MRTNLRKAPPLLPSYAPELCWTKSQLIRLGTTGLPRTVDIHCHCLPAIDDGPHDLDAAIRLCELLVDDGFTTIVATPHQLGPFNRENSAERIRSGVALLKRELADRKIPLEVYPGADVRIDERLLRLLELDEVVTVADMGKYLLLELPFHQYVDPMTLVKELQERNISVIMTHPERYPYLSNVVPLVEKWHTHGVAIQITAGSLLGHFGRTAERNAWELLHAGLVDLVATDAHNHESRYPSMSLAIEAVEAESGLVVARRLCSRNPWLVFQGEPVSSLRG